MPVNASTTVLGTLALAVIAITLLWRYFGLVILLSAQGVAWAGQVLTGARINQGKGWHWRTKDYDWFAFSTDQGWWLSRFAVALIVLPTPSLIGLLLARAATVAWSPRTVLVVLLIGIGLLALGHGDWQTLLLIAAVCGVLGLLIVAATPRAQAGAVVAFAWFYLLGGLRLTVEEAGRKHSQTANSFPGVLQRLTDVPGFVWMLAFLVVAVAAAVTGSRWLLA